MQTILSNQKSSVGSPYVFYNLAYEEVSRTTDSVTLKFREDANLQYSASTLGGSYWITSYVNIEGTEYAIEIKPSGQSWSGTTNHRVERTITISMPASQTLITNVKFRCASRNSDSGYLSSVNCSNISISLAHNLPMITNYTITETNQDLIDVGISNDMFVANLSKKSINILYTLYDNSTLARATAFNHVTPYSNTSLPILIDFTQNALVLQSSKDTGVLGVPFLVRIEDSLNGLRYFTNKYGNFSESPSSGEYRDFYNYIPYINVSITDNTTLARRNGQTSGRVKLNVNGVYYDGVVGNIDQTLYKPTIKYKFWKAEDSEPSTYPYTIPSENITISNGTFNVDGYEIGTIDETAVNFFDPEFAYRVKIYVEDNFTNKESSILSIPVGEAVWTEYKDRVDFKALSIQGELLNVEDIASKISFNVGYVNSQFRKYGNMVFISYQSDAGVHSLNELLFTMPNDLKPTNQVLAMCTLNDATFGVVSMNTAGECTINFLNSVPSSNTRVYFQMIYFTK